jgi:branched-chain amino acid transport system permease protein
LQTLIHQFWQLTFSGVAQGFIYVLISLGYTMVYGVLRMINFANSEIFMFGTFATVVVSRDLLGYGSDSQPIHGFTLIWSLALALVVSMIVSGVVALLVELIAYRRLRSRGTNRLAPLISAIGMSIVLSESMRLLTASRSVGSPRLLAKTSLAEIGGANIRVDQLMVVIVAPIMFFVLQWFVNSTRLGKGIRAVSMNEETAKLMGINLNRVISATFLIGGLMTGASAFFFETVYENTKYNIGFNLGLAAFTAAVLGGIGNIRGAFFGGLALGLLETYASAVLGSQWKPVTVFIVLVIVLLFRPNGIFGEAVQQTRV